MIKGKGSIRKLCGQLYDDDYQKACQKLPDNQTYNFLIVDEKKNKNLPYTTYLFSVVLRYLSQNLEGHPSPIGLYKYFEDMYAPIHTCTINGEQFDYCELKSEKVVDINNFIEKVVKYASEHWGIEVPRQEDLATPENRELHSTAYLNQEIQWGSVLSSLKKSKDNERRNKED